MITAYTHIKTDKRYYLQQPVTAIETLEEKEK